MISDAALLGAPMLLGQGLATSQRRQDGKRVGGSSRNADAQCADSTRPGGVRGPGSAGRPRPRMSELCSSAPGVQKIARSIGRLRLSPVRESGPLADPGCLLERVGHLQHAPVILMAPDNL